MAKEGGGGRWAWSGAPLARSKPRRERTADARDTRNCAARAPANRRRLLAGVLGNGVGLLRERACAKERGGVTPTAGSQRSAAAAGADARRERERERAAGRRSAALAASVARRNTKTHLAAILGDVHVHALHNVAADGRQEDGGQLQRLRRALLAARIVHRNRRARGRSRRHLRRCEDGGGRGARDVRRQAVGGGRWAGRAGGRATQGPQGRGRRAASTKQNESNGAAAARAHTSDDATQKKEVENQAQPSTHGGVGAKKKMREEGLAWNVPGNRENSPKIVSS